MQTQAFTDAFTETFTRNGSAPEVRTAIPAIFGEVLAEVHGMTTPSKMLLLNLAARSLPEGEVYLEAGTNRGATIIAASEGVDRSFVTIDNYSWFSATPDVARANLARYGRTRVEALEGSIWDLLRTWDRGRNVGVWSYDANHRFIDQWRALSLGERVLADEALVIVDVLSWPAVAAASDAFVRAHPRFEEILRIEDDADGRWASGVAVYRFRRSGAAGSPMGAARSFVLAVASYWVRHPRPILSSSVHDGYRRLPASFRARVRGLRSRGKG
ncbi:MAG: hypothetical protein ACYDD7_06595 [Acidimicrobiales bacterium]